MLNLNFPTHSLRQLPLYCITSSASSTLKICQFTHSCLVHRFHQQLSSWKTLLSSISLLPTTHPLLLPSQGYPVPELAAVVQTQQASSHSHANLDAEGTLSLLRGWALSPPAHYLLLAALPQPCSPAAGGAASAAPFAALRSARTAPETNTAQDTGQSSSKAPGRASPSPSTAFPNKGRH